MDDNSIMQFGEHKGKLLIEVPDSYLIWWYKQNKPLFEYIEDVIPENKLK